MTDSDQHPVYDPALDRLLSEMHIRIRQGKLDEIAERLAKAKALAPDHAEVLEIEGDVAFAKGRFIKAELIYKQAWDADRKNARLEEKYATAVVKARVPDFYAQQLGDDSFWSNRVPRKPIVSTLQSALLPGLGQLYNGDWFKGLVVIGFYLLGSFAQFRAIYYPINAFLKNHQVSTFFSSVFGTLLHDSQLLMTFMLLALWFYAVIDAYLVARSTK
jgi:TM2 domain-containing membrane protein YozV